MAQLGSSEQHYVEVFVHQRRCVRWAMLFLLVILFHETALALDLVITRPVIEFVTNNSELVIEGIVEHEESESLILSVNLPAGLRNLGSIEGPIYSLVADLGGIQALSSIFFIPVYKDGLLFGPRIIGLSVSNDGQRFSYKGEFTSSLGVVGERDAYVVDLMDTLNVGFVKIDMVDSWQAGGVKIEDIGFMGRESSVIRGKLKNMSFIVPASPSGVTEIRTVIPLKEGENQIYISARYGEPELVDPSEEDVELIKVTYIPEISAIEKSIVLSDGYKAEVTIQQGALHDRVKKINIINLNTNDIDWQSYADNPYIVKGTKPVLAYKFDIGLQVPFAVTAKDFLERQPPELAVDGNPEYPSTWMTVLSPLPVWLRIDLRDKYTIGSITIVPHAKGNVSYGPKKLSILVSNDDVVYDEVLVKDDCPAKKFDIPIPSNPNARYVKIVIEEGIQGNNIQINEVEIRDSEGIRIIPHLHVENISLMKVATLTMAYDTSDVLNANIRSEKNLAIFAWEYSSRQWRLVGGNVDTRKRIITVNLNYLTTFAIFESNLSRTEVRWSNNPFSPNGDGITDTTTIFINIADEGVSQAKVEIFDCTGMLVRTLIQEGLSSGHISILWDGRDEQGRLVDVGPYIYQVTVGKKVINGSLIVVK